VQDFLNLTGLQNTILKSLGTKKQGGPPLHFWRCFAFGIVKVVALMLVGLYICLAFRIVISFVLQLVQGVSVCFWIPHNTKKHPMHYLHGVTFLIYFA